MAKYRHVVQCALCGAFLPRMVPTTPDKPYAYVCTCKRCGTEWFNGDRDDETLVKRELCMATAPDIVTIYCDRAKGHVGPHSWEK